MPRKALPVTFKKHSRRDFIKAVALACASGAALKVFPTLAMDAPLHDCLIVGSQMNACLVDLTSRSIRSAEIGFKAHSFIKVPGHKMRFIGIEKWGPNAADVDFETGAVRKFTSGDSAHFYGHGFLYEADGLIYITRVNMTEGMGYLAAYDPESLAEKRLMPIVKGGIHECRLIGGGKVMIASSGIVADNYGTPQQGTRVSPSSVVTVDLNGDGAVVSRLDIDDAFQIIGHFGITKTGKILALSGPAPGSADNHGWLYYSPDAVSPFTRISFNKIVSKRVMGEMLSVALNTDETVAVVTNPGSETSIIIDMDAGQVIKLIPMNANGVSYSRSLSQFVGTKNGLKGIAGGFSKIETLAIHTEAVLDGAHSISVALPS